MPVSVCKKAPANVSSVQQLKNGVHQRDIFGNEDGGPHMTSCIMSITNREGGGITIKPDGIVHAIITEGEICVEDGTKPGETSLLGPGDVFRIDKGTATTLTSPTAGKAFYVVQREFGVNVKKYIV